MEIPARAASARVNTFQGNVAGRGEGGLGMGSECAPSRQRDSLIHNARVSAPGLSGQLLQLLLGIKHQVS
ncbi:MAG: hypothetical protein ACTIB2_11910, partial [Brachybacterium tyrofermentans]